VMQVDSDKVDSQILAKTGVPIENFWVLACLENWQSWFRNGV